MSLIYRCSRVYSAYWRRWQIVDAITRGLADDGLTAITREWILSTFREYVPMRGAKKRAGFDGSGLADMRSDSTQDYEWIAKFNPPPEGAPDGKDNE